MCKPCHHTFRYASVSFGMPASEVGRLQYVWWGCLPSSVCTSSVHRLQAPTRACTADPGTPAKTRPVRLPHATPHATPGPYKPPGPHPATADPPSRKSKSTRCAPAPEPSAGMRAPHCCRASTASPSCTSTCAPQARATLHHFSHGAGSVCTPTPSAGRARPVACKPAIAATHTHPHPTLAQRGLERMVRSYCTCAQPHVLSLPQCCKHQPRPFPHPALHPPSCRAAPAARP